MVNSREKGKRGEREFRDFVTKTTGRKARRGQQYSGGDDSPDVVVDGWAGTFHPEVKYTQTLRLKEALEQASSDAGVGVVPVVFSRKKNERWIAHLDAEAMVKIIEIIVGQAKEG